MKLSKLLITGTILLGIMVPYLGFAQTESPQEEPFSDVSVGSSHYVAIRYLFENNIIHGFGDGTFRPRDTVNRVEALAMILNSAKSLPSAELQDSEEYQLPVDTALDLKFPFETDITLKTPSMETPLVLERTGVLRLLLPKGGVIIAGRLFLNQELNFTDIDKNAWYIPTLQRAISLDIVKGYGDGTFKPNITVKLTEALAMLLRSHRIDVPELTQDARLPLDTPRESWYANNVSYGVARYLLTLSLSNQVFPSKELTRGELATLIYRFIQNDRLDMQFGKASWYRDGASVIRVPGREEYFEKYITAAHREFPFGTVVRVTNMRNAKYVDVVINDRGPFLPGRVIDLSKTAFSTLEEPENGIVSVQVQLLERQP